MQVGAVDAASIPHPALQKHQRRLSKATTAGSSFSSSSFSSDVACDHCLSSSASMDNNPDEEDDSGDRASAMLVRELQQENELLRHDLDKLQDVHELAMHMRKQVQMLEMEMLIRGSESRESLTGLMSSLELRESFRHERLSMLKACSDGYTSSDCNERVSMLGDDGGCYYNSDDDGDDAMVGDHQQYNTNGHNDSSNSNSVARMDDSVEPEEERECDAFERQSFFVEKFIDPNDFTDDEEDIETPETVIEPECCSDCDTLSRELESARDAAVQAQRRIAELEAALAAKPPPSPPLRAPESSASKWRITELEHVRVKSHERIQRLEFDHVALQNRESAAQQRIDELEAELAHVQALSSCQKELLDAFQSDLMDEDELLLRVEGGGAVGSNDNKRRGHTQSSLLQRLVQRRDLGRAEVATLLVALALLCATLYSVSGALVGVAHRR